MVTNGDQWANLLFILPLTGRLLIPPQWRRLVLLWSACYLLSTVGVSPGPFFFRHVRHPIYQAIDISVLDPGIFLWSQVQPRTGLKGLWSVAQQLLQNIWMAWFNDLFVGISWAHAHIPGTQEPLGTLKQLCQHPDLRGIPSRCFTWGDR